MQLAMQAAMQYGWDGIILGYAAKVGRGGSTGRIAFVSPQNELYTIDDRGAIKTHATLEPNLAQNAENALTLIRQKICPTERAHLMIKHDAPPMMEAMEMAGHLQAVQGPELPHALDDKHEMSGPEMQWLQQNMDKSGPMMHPALLNLGQPLPMHPQALHGAGVGSAMSHSMAMPLGPGLGHPMGQPSHLAAAHMQGAHMGGPLGSAAQAMGAMQMQMHGHVAHTVDMNMESVSKRMRGDE